MRGPFVVVIMTITTELRSQTSFGSAERDMECNEAQPAGKTVGRQPIWRLFRAALIAYLVAVIMLMSIERRLIYPIPDSQAGDWAPSGIHFEDVWLDTADGHRLHGWFLPAAKPLAFALYFHGNGEDVSSCGPELSTWRDSLQTSILVMDYRGYGKSSGKPLETDLISDGILAANWLANREGISPSELILWGRSIGGGVAAGMCQSIQPKAMILECTFDSLTNVASRHIRWLPVSYLMRNRYPSATRLVDYQGDVLMWHGDADTIVPIACGQKLFDAIGSARKLFIESPGRGHNDYPPSRFKMELKNMVKRISLPS